MTLEDRAVPNITFVRENIQVEVPDGDHVRYPALEHDVQIYCGDLLRPVEVCELPRKWPVWY